MPSDVFPLFLSLQSFKSGINKLDLSSLEYPTARYGLPLSSWEPTIKKSVLISRFEMFFVYFGMLHSDLYRKMEPHISNGQTTHYLFFWVWCWFHRSLDVEVRLSTVVGDADGGSAGLLPPKVVSSSQSDIPSLKGYLFSYQI